MQYLNYKNAVDCCNEILQRHPDSPKAEKAKRLLAGIPKKFRNNDNTEDIALDYTLRGARAPVSALNSNLDRDNRLDISQFKNMPYMPSNIKRRAGNVDEAFAEIGQSRRSVKVETKEMVNRLRSRYYKSPEDAVTRTNFQYPAAEIEKKQKVFASISSRYTKRGESAYKNTPLPSQGSRSTANRPARPTGRTVSNLRTKTTAKTPLQRR